MRQIDALGGARRRIAIEREAGPLEQFLRAIGEHADAQLRTLQIDEDADRPFELLLERANQRDALAHHVVRGVAHVDAEHVGAGQKQRGDHLALDGSRAQGGDDFDAAVAAGQAEAPYLRAGRRQGVLGSVSWTVQFLASLPVSISKKPVRS